MAISINSIKPTAASGSSAGAKKALDTRPGYTYVQKTIGNDTYLVMAQSQVELEDEFSNLYYTVQNQSNIFLQPPFDPQALLGFSQTNNVLNQCIEAMEVNIDATGHEFIPSQVADSLVAKAQSDWQKKQAAAKAKKDQQRADYKNAVATFHYQAAAANSQSIANAQSASTPPTDASTDDPEDKSGQTDADPNQAGGANNPMPTDYPAPLEYEPELAQPEFGNGIDPDELLRAKEFFNEPYPGMGFAKIRRKLRREMETVGYAYLEVLRNLNGDIVAVRNIETHNTRMVKLDAPILVEKTVMRGETEVKLQLWERQRRFAQRVALKQLVYYREFGTARHVDRTTGRWETPDLDGAPGNPVLPENRGTELIVFGVHPDTSTPYFLPRWINQMPSVIGSRKAEELNLEFLDSGGMPPAIIFIQGGTLAKDAADQLKMYLSGKNKNKHRAVVVEAQSSSGSLESAGSVQVKVEKFGDRNANDAMFTKYDAMTEEHIRVGFRLPPLFLGRSADYSFATAQTSYMVAEEQVFQVERNAFDDAINNTLMKEMGFKTLRYKSNQITLADANAQVTALTQAKGTVTNESFVNAINKVTGLDLDVAAKATTDPSSPSPFPGGGGAFGNGSSGGGGGHGGGAATAVGGSSDLSGLLSGGNNPNTSKLGVDAPSARSALDLVDLAQDYLSLKGLAQKREISKARGDDVAKEIAKLTKRERKAFDSLVASYTFGSAAPDLVHITHHSCNQLHDH